MSFFLSENEMATFNPELKEILAETPPYPTSWTSFPIDQTRAYMALHGAPPPLPTNLQTSEIAIPVRDGTTIIARIYSPVPGSLNERVVEEDSNEGGYPVFLIFHGGGFCLGDLNSEDGLCRRWVEECDGVAINVAYRRAPENRFPTAVRDAEDALRWVAANMQLLNGNPKKGFIAGGSSAGATLSTVIAHLARDTNMTPSLTGLYLSCPSLLLPDATPEKWAGRLKSRHVDVGDVILTHETERWFMQNYAPDPHSPLASPLLFPSRKNLPKIYIQICGLDILRDEEKLFVELVREEGGIVVADEFPGLPHIFWTQWPRAKFSIEHERKSRRALRGLVYGFDDEQT